jgi:NDP-sugar pyrophosphorylase family protein
MQAVILAGGKGSRLRPFTNTFPKPLVPVGDKAILEIVLEQLRYHGVTEIVMAVNHMSHLIRAFFGAGERLGMKIDYSEESEPLGTAGPLRLMNSLDENFLMLNGDILTTLDFSDLFRTHVGNQQKVTIATFEKELKIDLGVLKVKDGLLSDYIEKPTEYFTVSMGIYAMHRSVLEVIPAEGKYDLNTIMLDLRDRGVPIHCYQGNCEWLDIGRASDYEEATRLFEEGRDRFLPGTT